MDQGSARPHVQIYTDGGCEPDPGPGGYGAVLVHPKKRAELSGGFRLTTNNRMEILAAIKGLEMLRQPCWKCSTPVIKQKARKRPNRGYYYEYYLWCPKGQATYEVEEAKRLIEQPPSMF